MLVNIVVLSFWKTTCAHKKKTQDQSGARSHPSNMFHPALIRHLLLKMLFNERALSYAGCWPVHTFQN